MTFSLVSGVPVARAEQLEPRSVASAPRIDGHLDDSQWSAASFVGEFTQRSPEAGAPAPAATEVSVAYNRRMLFVAFRCEGTPRAVLSRRDVVPPDGDYVAVYVDGTLDRRTARGFFVTASSVQTEGALSFDSSTLDTSWNGVWHSAVRVTDDGWTVEIAIPLPLLGLAREEPVLGMHFRRYFADGPVVTERLAVPLTSQGYVSHFEEVGPLRGAEVRRAFEIRPYLRLDIRPRVADGAGLRRTPFRAAAGLDLRLGIRGDLAVHLSILPDFGQAEIDPAVLNLSAYETYYPERRQLFLEEADLFRFAAVATRGDRNAFQLVHTRRIGARPAAPDLLAGESLAEMDDTAPVEAVVRLAGQVRPGTSVGVLAALVGPAQAYIEGEDGRRRVEEASHRRYYSAARLRQSFGDRSSIGGLFSATSELDGSEGAYAGAVDLDLQPRGSNHRLTVLGAASYAEDEWGGGLHMVAGRLGGEGLRWMLSGLVLSPDFDVNGLGWLRRADMAGANLTVGWVTSELPEPFGYINIDIELDGLVNWDGELIDGGGGFNLRLGVPGRDRLYSHLWIIPPHMDDRETRGGPSLPRPVYVWGLLGFSSSSSRALGFTLNLSAYHSEEDTGLTVYGSIRWTPARWLSLVASVTYSRNSDVVLWLDDLVGDAGQDLPLLGRAWIETLNTNLRATLALTPTLSLQAFVQLLSSAGDYRQLMTFVGGEYAIRESDDDYDFDEVVLLANVVVRWEIRPELVLYGVYTHSGAGAGTAGRLNIGAHIEEAAWSAASDLFLLKLELVVF